jgi:hypothetical protein
MVPFFDVRELAQPQNEFVAWVDVMGTQAHTYSSLSKGANYMFKLHIAALECPRDGVKLYPVMDAFYATAPDGEKLHSFLRELFRTLAQEFMRQPKPWFRFVIRGGVAYGALYHGCDMPAASAPTLANHERHRDALIYGLPMMQAYQAEHDAVPFGFAVHPSAAPSLPTKPWWKGQIKPGELMDALAVYFAWWRNESSRLYPREKIDAHEAKAKQHLQGEA